MLGLFSSPYLSRPVRDGALPHHAADVPVPVFNVLASLSGSPRALLSGESSCACLSQRRGHQGHLTLRDVPREEGASRGTEPAFKSFLCLIA